MISTRARMATSWHGEPHAPPCPRVAPLMPLAAQAALADLQVRMPTVEYRELEFEITA